MDVAAEMVGSWGKCDVGVDVDIISVDSECFAFGVEDCDCVFVAGGLEGWGCAGCVCI